MTRNIDSTKLAQSFLIRTKRGHMKWERAERGSPYFQEFSGTESPQECYVSRVAGKNGSSATVGVFRVIYSQYDSENEFYHHTTGHEIVLYSRDAAAISRVQVPYVVAEQLFDEARINAHSKDLDVFREFLDVENSEDET